MEAFKWLCVSLYVWLAGRGFNIPALNVPGSSFYIAAAWLNTAN